MYGNIRRGEKYISRLCDFIRVEYQIVPISLTPAKRGFYGETWKLETASKNYFVKLGYSPRKETYKQSFAVIELLCKHGIDFISKIAPNANGELFALFDTAVLGVFEWIEGENIETDATKIPEYHMLAKVYTISPDGVDIGREGFSDRNAEKFFEQWKASGDRRILSLLEKNRAKLEHRAKRQKKFAEACRIDLSGFVITHGDAGGNFIVSGDRNYIVDWDNPLLAPPERDAWRMCGREWAREAFQSALRQNGIEYRLRPERLAYYCYDFFFFYLTAFLDASAQAEKIEEYIDGWIEESFAYADNIQ